MEKIFIAGPIKVKQLDSQVENRILNIISKKYEILIGDARGVDKLAQQFLLNNNYSNITIYCINQPRNNIGNWNTKSIKVNSNKMNYNDYSLKDRQMANDATFGLMIWNGKSRGTLNNILNLLELNKKTILYFIPTNKFFTISNVSELKRILDLCDNKDIETLNKNILLINRLNRLSQFNIPFN